ncbi:twin-arginine translocation signal domain-containing protein [Tranquillimonas alkanivorans]|uniref:Formate dehydrogenase region TAT target n=1 Tax=Tranquillimonas alkanivorans TaxID=441119 RepID=A0A1I5KJ24_9RHOB|nr:twin-arginine translocation signal domain-containing protein [Tranquillimonas alkanivorans]SFO84833.1 formate dehydrogenase region TAT target [Tranquillimonas alkanivorans]
MKEKPEGASRRDFLKLASVSAPAAVAAATLPATQADAAAEIKADGRMQDTAHTRAYYDSARF